LKCVCSFNFILKIRAVYYIIYCSVFFKRKVYCVLMYIVGISVCVLIYKIIMG